MREELAKTFGISTQQLKVFFLAFLAMFIITSLQFLGVRSPWQPPKLTMPISEQVPSTFSFEDSDVLDTFDTLKTL